MEIFSIIMNFLKEVKDYYFIINLKIMNISNIAKKNFKLINKFITNEIAHLSSVNIISLEKFSYNKGLYKNILNSDFTNFASFFLVFQIYIKINFNIFHSIHVHKLIFIIYINITLILK